MYKRPFTIEHDIYNACYYGPGIERLMGKTKAGWALRIFIRGKGE